MSNLPPKIATLRIQSNFLRGIKLFLNGKPLRTIWKCKDTLLELPPGEHQLYAKDSFTQSEILMLKIQGGEAYELQFERICFALAAWGIFGSIFICALLVLLIPYGFKQLPGTLGMKCAVGMGLQMYPMLFAAYQKERKWGHQWIQLKVTSGPEECYQLCASPNFSKRTPIPLWLLMLLLMLCTFILLDYVAMPFNQWISHLIYCTFIGHY